MFSPPVSDRIWLGWAAGLFDGEGSIGIYNNAVMLRIAMTDAGAVERFRDITRMGTLRWNFRKDHRKASLVWSIYRRDRIHRLLRLFMPLLVAKREAATIALRFIESSNRREKACLTRKLRKKMNRRRGRHSPTRANGRRAKLRAQ